MSEPSPGHKSTPDPDEGPTDAERWAQFKAAFGAWLRERWEEATDVHARFWPPPWLSVGALVVGLAVLVFIVIPLIDAILTAVGGAAAVQAGAGASWLAGLELVGVVTGAISSWFAAHTAGLGVSADLLITIWWVAVAVAFGLAWLFKVRGAQVAWTLQGAAAAAMAWSVTEPPAQATAAGITVFWWAIGSVFALRRGTHQTVPIWFDGPKSVLERPQATVWPSNLRAVADFLDAAGDVFAGDDNDPRAAGISEDVRSLRRELIPVREYAPVPPEHEDRDNWRPRLAPFVNAGDRGQVVEVHYRVAEVMEQVLVDFSVTAYLNSLLDPEPPERPVEDLAFTVSWLARSSQGKEAFALMETWWRRARARHEAQNPDSAPLDAAAALDAVDRSWPAEFAEADRAPIMETLARAWSVTRPTA